MKSYKESSWMDDELRILKESVEHFFIKECEPEKKRWKEQGFIDRETWVKFAEMGFLCPGIPEEYGGVGGSFAHDAVIIEAQARTEFSDFNIGVHNIAAHYILAFGSEEQKKDYLPKMVSAELLGAIAMTEPGAGSDLQGISMTAIRDGEEYVLNGSKTFITNGYNSDLIIVAVKTNPKEGAKGVSLVIVEKAKVDGLEVGRPLEKLGRKLQDTTELFFDNVRIPVKNLLGAEENRGFAQLMQQLPRERMQIALTAVATLEQAIELTIQYANERKAFGKPIMAFQNTRFKLAERQTEATIGRIFVDQCMERILKNELDVTTACMAKWWTTQKLCETVDECLQLFGGYGYMQEYPIARMYVDSRVAKIYGGTNEIMKEVISRSFTG